MSEIASILQPGVTIVPKISINDAKIYIEKLYGLKCKTIVELNSYDDKNYKITVEESFSNKYISKIDENGYVFKVLNGLDSKKVAFVEAQNEMMIFLGKNNIKCSQPVLNKSGQYYSIETLKDSGQHVMRLLQFITGTIFCEIHPTKCLLFDAGQYIANLDVILKDFYHPAYKTHKSLWMLESVPEIKQFLYVIEDREDKKLVEDIILEFETEVLENIGILEKGYLHGDFNEQNIIVQQDNGWKIDAILDFGDTQYSCLLFELAIASMYMIVQSKDIKILGYFLAGYSTIRPIPDQEYKILKVCIAARFCQSLILGIYSSLQNPDNKYILTTQTSGWILLKKLWAEPNEKLIEEWKSVVEKCKNPNDL